MTFPHLLLKTFLISLFLLSTSADVTLSSMSSSSGDAISTDGKSATLGYSLQAIGDINGDSISDFVIGDYGYDSNRGRVVVLYGSSSGLSNIAISSLSSDQGFIITGENQNDYFGWVVASAGDYNHDGLKDFIILAKGYTTNSMYGRAYVVFGTKSKPSGYSAATIGVSTSGFIIQSSTSGIPLDYSVGSVGDMNGDTVDDIFISSSAGNIGVIFVIYGTSNPINPKTLALNAYNSVTSTLPSTGSTCFSLGWGFCVYVSSFSSTLLGVSVSRVGDANGDGLSDMVIASNQYAYVIYGSNTRLQDVDVGNIFADEGYRAIPPKNGQVMVSGGGDINGDGRQDILVSDVNNNVVYVLYGKNATGYTRFYLSNITVTQGYKITRTSEGTGGSYSGSGRPDKSLAIGDINNDGYADIIIGVPTASPPMLYVVFGVAGKSFSNITTDYSDNLKIIGSTGNLAGASISAAGDVNGDGINDIIIGAPQASGASVYIVYGSKSYGPSKLSTGAIIGIAIGSAAGLALIITGIVCFCKRRRQRKYQQKKKALEAIPSPNTAASAGPLEPQNNSSNRSKNFNMRDDAQSNVYNTFYPSNQIQNNNQALAYGNQVHIRPASNHHARRNEDEEMQIAMALSSQQYQAEMQARYHNNNTGMDGHHNNPYAPQNPQHGAVNYNNENGENEVPMVLDQIHFQQE